VEVSPDENRGLGQERTSDLDRSDILASSEEDAAVEIAGYKQAVVNATEGKELSAK
jgi:hypothetical protein